MSALATAFGATKQADDGVVAEPVKAARDSRAYWEKTTSLRTTAIALNDILQVTS